jgi:ABC-type branched-subunit amino acid transport system substrate-binding protein
MAEETGIRRWYIVGNDYVWPRSSATAVWRWAQRGNAQVCGERYVPLGCCDFSMVIDKIRRSSADGVLMFLVGQDAVHFNRQFAKAGLDEAMVRMTTLTDENMLLASGGSNTRSLFVTAGYFDNLTTGESLDFVGRYTRQFGLDAPVPSSLGESCYEGITLYSSLAQSAKSLQPGEVLAAAETARYESPRGVVQIRQSHAVQDVYLARADATEFDVLQRVSSGV